MLRLGLRAPLVARNKSNLHKYQSNRTNINPTAYISIERTVQKYINRTFKSWSAVSNNGHSYFIYGNCCGLKTFLLLAWPVVLRYIKMSVRNQLTHYELEEFFRLIRRTYLISLGTRRRKKNQQPSEIQLHYEYEVLRTNPLKYRASGGLEHLISQHPLWRLKVVLPPPRAKRNKASPRNVAFSRFWRFCP